MRIVSKATLICWGFVCAFVIILSVIMVIPSGAVWIVSTLLGFALLALVGYSIFQIYKKEGFEFGWFLAVKKGYRHLFGGFIGLALFLFGILGIIVPQQTEQLAEMHAMKVAAVFVFLFWFALIFTFLGWALICFSESAGYLRLKKFKSSLGSFALGILMLLLALLFCSMFLDVINENFLSLSETVRNRTYICVALLTIGVGLFAGMYEDLEKLAEENQD